MKLLQERKQQIKKKKLGSTIDKKGMYSYASYLQQRKTNPYKISYKKNLNYNFQAKKLQGKSSNNLLLLFENRLDTTLYRIKFAQSLPQARQLIHHQKVYINGNSVIFPSYQLKPGDILHIKQTDTAKFKSRTFSLIGLPFKSTKKAKNIRKNRKYQKRKIPKKKPAFLFRPLQYEINFITGTAIFLYPPQKLYYSQRLYPDLIRRSFKQTL